ncbi:hypothetical protein Scep_011204 [Stephania cephalantha]|uniref:Terpene synthase metal-binding domain-containing protein n=1 Tax=Stephania cephalantha TaxID=152367 RepID=A0AAP0JCN1_9MAGN
MMGRFCWFLHHKEVRMHIEENNEYFASAMFNVHRATDLMFLEEKMLGEARSFSRKELEKTISSAPAHENNALIRMIEHELKLPWLARMDHLEHRKFIEEGVIMTAPCMAKASFSRSMSSPRKAALLKLAARAYTFRQSVYMSELEKLTRWSKETGLSGMGFGREKTTYCYFACAASISLPVNSDSRIIAAKCGILITVADDFYDMEGSLEELYLLTDAVKRWDGKSLKGHARTIFDALVDLVRDVVAKFSIEQRLDMAKLFQDLWYHTFESWMTEAKWSRSAHIASTDEYLQTGMTSIAAHVVVLMAACSMDPTLPLHTIKNCTDHTLTKLLMVSCRLLNDIQSYEKEEKDGKMNLVTLHMKDNAKDDINTSIVYVKEILERQKKDFIEHVLMDDICDMPKPLKQLHFGCLKTFQMFFNSSNGFDSEIEMIDAINKAIYLPLDIEIEESLSSPSPMPLKISNLNGTEKNFSTKKSTTLTLNATLNSQRFPSISWASPNIIAIQASAGPKFNLPKMSPKYCLI